MPLYCAWCMPVPIKADPAARYERTVEMRAGGTRHVTVYYLCRRHAAALEAVVDAVVIGTYSDWPDYVRHDLKQCTAVVREH